MQVEKLQLIQALGNIVRNTGSSEEILQSIVDYLTVHLKVQLCAVSVYDQQEQRLFIQASNGLQLEGDSLFESENNSIRNAFAKGKTINTLLSDDKGLTNAAARQLYPEINSVLAMPLIACGHPVGVLSLARKTKRIFPPGTINLLKTAAPALAVFLLNNNLPNRKKKLQAVSPPRSSEFHFNRNDTLNGKCDLHYGKTIVGGVSRGRAVVLVDEDSLDQIQPERTNDPANEKMLFDQARQLAKDYLTKIQKEASIHLAEADTQIFAIHLLLLDDPMLCGRVRAYIDKKFQLDSALSLTLKQFTEEYRNMEDEYLRERLYDIKDVLLRLKNAHKNMSRKDSPQKNDENGISANERQIILVARELLPSQLFASPIPTLQGIICETGGPTSHAAILAKALRIPMLVGIPNIHNIVKAGDKILLDSSAGLCYIHPSSALVKQYRLPLAHFRKFSQKKTTPPELLPAVRGGEQTRDGTTIRISGNLTLFSELPTLQRYGIGNIGLYRTEFLFMLRNSMPSEEDQYQVFTKIIKASTDYTVTIRALDIGGDKPLSYVKWDTEENPSLGWRGLRFLLSNPKFLHIHLRAILRATTAGNVRILFPMITDLTDIQAVKEAVDEARLSLDKDGLAYSDSYRLGAMIETPSAVICLEQLLQEVDFISIGTNDLVQYMFAVDRNNSKVNRWYRQTHPLVLKTLKYICDVVARYPGKDVCLCGELAGNPRALPLLIGAGLRHLSMTATPVPAIREYITRLTVDECRGLFQQAVQCSSDSQVLKLIQEYAVSKNIELSNLS